MQWNYTNMPKKCKHMNTAGKPNIVYLRALKKKYGINMVKKW